ncbi:acyl-CoA dehydrogenase [Actinomadura sp. DSM 109109]|nr:acyl-CoA dehydrogenase [Actinomadura lepetitiana]
MDFAMSPRQRELCAETVRFARQELSGRTGDSDRSGSLDTDGWRKAAEFGALGWPVPREYGGSGLDPLTSALAFEALGYGCSNNGLLFAINNHVWACEIYLVKYGTEEQKARWLPRLCGGTVIGAHALTEPQAGSDMLALATAARPDGEGWVLNGTKTFISNGSCADLFVVFARTGETGAPERALSAFLVPADAPGVRVTRELEKSGLRGAPMGEIQFSDVRLGAEHLLGREGAGYQVFTSTIEWERGFLFASGVGTMRRLLETCVEHAAKREQFGRPVGSFQAVSHTIADMRVRLELAQLMLYKFGWLKREGRLAMLESSILKLVVSEGLRDTALEAVQIHGARGYVTEGGMERELRDALAGTIYGGTSQIQRSIIAGLLGLPGAS